MRTLKPQAELASIKLCGFLTPWSLQILLMWPTVWVTLTQLWQSQSLAPLPKNLICVLTWFDGHWDTCDNPQRAWTTKSVSINFHCPYCSLFVTRDSFQTGETALPCGHRKKKKLDDGDSGLWMCVWHLCHFSVRTVCSSASVVPYCHEVFVGIDRPIS